MWRFAHLTDTHLASMVDGEWNNRFLCTMMPDMINCLRRDLEGHRPDFLLVTGDIASQHTRDAVFAARDLLDSLGVPYYPAGGNHDFVLRDSRRWFLEAYTSRLPDEDTVYSFTHKGLHFCVLDPWWKWRDSSLCPFSDGPIANIMDVSIRGARWALPPHQFGWLEDDLSENAGLPTVIAIHYPLVPAPKRLRRPGFKDAGHLDNGSMVLDLLARHPQVKAVFSGHMHMHFIERRDGITHVVTGAMPEFPCEYRDVHVYDDRIDVHTCGLSDKSFARRSLIDENDWTAGQPQDRTMSISLVDR